MGDPKVPVLDERVYTYHGMFFLKNTFQTMTNYIENGLAYDDFMIKEYEEQDMGGKKKIVAKFECTRYFNDVFKIHAKGELNLSGSDTEAELNGKKVSITSGTAKFVLNNYLEVDWSAEREPNKFYRFLNQVYNKFVGHDEQGIAMGAAAGDGAKMIAKFKELVNIEIK